MLKTLKHAEKKLKHKICTKTILMIVYLTKTRLNYSHCWSLKICCRSQYSSRLLRGVLNFSERLRKFKTRVTGVPVITRSGETSETSETIVQLTLILKKIIRQASIKAYSLRNIVSDTFYDRPNWLEGWILA